MLLCIIGGVLACLKYQNKLGRLHESLDYILYLRPRIDFDFITAAFTILKSVVNFSFNTTGF